MGSCRGQRTGRAIWIAIFALLLCAALAAPVVADPTGEPLISADSLLSSPTPGAATGEEIQAIRAASDVSAAQAEASLAVQRRATKVNIVEQLRQSLGSEYGGVWFDAGAGEFVVPVSIAGETQGATNAATQMIAQEFAAASLGGGFRTEQVLSSEAELEAAQLDLTERLSGYLEAHQAQTSLDPAVNAVIVRVPEHIDSQTRAEIEKVASTSTVKTEVREMPDEAFEVKPAACDEVNRKCDLPLRSGQVIYGGPFPGPEGETDYEICTDGFRANGSDGKKYILTAGHCVLQGGHPGGTPIWTWMTQSPNEGEHSIGTTTQWHYDGKDWAKIDATGTWADTAPWPTIGAYWGSTQEYPIVGEAKSYKGQTLCHIGMNSGASCGIVKEVNVTVDYNDGARLNSMYEVGGSGLALQAGDSGGPVIASNIALGIVSGGTSAYSNATLFFSDIMAANAELNTNIVGSGAPETITGSAEGIKTYDATVYGQINPHGLPTSYQVEYGVGGYTNSTAPVNGGSGQGFISISVPLSGLEPGTTYQYRLKATNGLNSAFGAQRSFKTFSWPLVDGNLPTLDISGKQARVRALVRPNKLPTTYWFEYGPTSAMGKESPLKSAGSALGPVEVSQTLTGLSPSTKYYYRVIVTSSGGLNVGPTGNFTTAPPGWTYLSRFGGSGTGPGQFEGIADVAVDAVGNAFYVADRFNHRVQKFSPSGEFLMQFGVKGSGPGEFVNPRSITVDSGGNVWVGDEGNQRIQEFSSTGTFIRQIGPNEASSNRPKRPTSIAIGGNGRIYVVDGLPESILEYSSTPNAEGKYFLKRWPYEYRPLGLTTASDGTVYFVNREQLRVMKVTSMGMQKVFDIPTTTTPAIVGPAGLAVDPQGNFLISSGNEGSVIQLSPTGSFQGSFGTKGTGPGQMNLPSSLALAPSGLLFVGSQAGNAEITRWAN